MTQTMFKRGDRVAILATGETATIHEVCEDAGQIFVPLWYSVLLDNSGNHLGMVYPDELRPLV